MSSVSEISINELKPGNVLAGDIMDKNGLVLLKKDTVLKETNIHVLKKRHVRTVPISVHKQLSLKEAQALALSIKKTVDFRCRYLENNEDIAQLKKMLCAQLFKQAIEETNQ